MTPNIKETNNIFIPEEVYEAIKNGLKKKEEDIKEHGKGYEAVESVAMHLFQMPHTHRPHK